MSLSDRFREIVMADGGGRKDDSGKPRLDLIAPELLLGMGQVLDAGASEYGERNWERGMAWSRAYAALGRHMAAWWMGQDTDPKTGLSHLHHAACNIMFLVAYQHRASGTDDRPSDFYGSEP